MIFMPKSYYIPKKESPKLQDFLHVPYLLVLSAVVAANFIESETVTLMIFFAFLLIYSIKKYDSRIPIAFALLLLIISAFVLAYKNEALANQIAIYAYYYLVVGVLLQLIEYIRNPEDENETE